MTATIFYSASILCKLICIYKCCITRTASCPQQWTQRSTNVLPKTNLKSCFFKTFKILSDHCVAPIFQEQQVYKTFSHLPKESSFRLTEAAKRKKKGLRIIFIKRTYQISIFKYLIHTLSCLISEKSLF